MSRAVSSAFLLVLALAVAAPPARAVCVGVDTDADGVCDVDDNCPATPNADQFDNDEDAAGNPCDSVDGAFVEPKVSIRRAANALRGQAKAYLRANPTPAALEFPAGVTATLHDAGTTVVSAAFAAGDCVVVRGASRCALPDHTARLVAKPVRNAPGVFRMRLRIRAFAAATTFPPPATLSLASGDVTWRSDVTQCSVQANGITCKTP